MHETLLPRCLEHWPNYFVHDVLNILFPRCLEHQQVIKMYSPKIDEQIIAQLYYLAKVRKIPMTELVNGIVREGVAKLIDRDRAEVEGDAKL